ncbi:transposase [Umezawaea tangerina]|uniref:transposase n=1 Tax=Umezawaea tangerina TaxID=84725 RepID=UPI003CCC0E41
MRRHELTDEQWHTIEPLLPPSGVNGRTRMDDRRVLNGMLFKSTAGQSPPRLRRADDTSGTSPPDTGTRRTLTATTPSSGTGRMVSCAPATRQRTRRTITNTTRMGQPSHELRKYPASEVSGHPLGGDVDAVVVLVDGQGVFQAG